MPEPIMPNSVPPLRLRYRPSERENGPDVIVDIGWSPVQDDVDAWSIASLSRGGVTHMGAKSTWDVEDPTDPDNDTYPPAEAAELVEGGVPDVRR